jgi:hypothetical protein
MFSLPSFSSAATDGVGNKGKAKLALLDIRLHESRVKVALVATWCGLRQRCCTRVRERGSVLRLHL